MISMLQRNKIALVVAGVLILAFLALQTPLLTRVRGGAWRAWLAVVTRIVPVGMLAIDNDVLNQVQHLTSENIRLKAELNDYRHLREQLGSPTLESYRAIPAQVAGRPLDTFGVSFII